MPSDSDDQDIDWQNLKTITKFDGCKLENVLEFSLTFCHGGSALFQYFTRHNLCLHDITPNSTEILIFQMRTAVVLQNF